MTDPITPEAIAATAELLGPRTYGATLTLPWDKASALLSAAKRSLEYEAFFREHGLALMSNVYETGAELVPTRTARLALTALLSRLK